jgi:hypothetical protein
MEHDNNTEHWGSYGQLSSSAVYDKVRGGVKTINRQKE